MSESQSLDPHEAASFLLGAIKDAHEREPFVGGLFNAYEAAVHYEIFNTALARGLDDTWQEAPLQQGQTTCDLVLPLKGDQRLWLEVKLWWFLFGAYDTPYVNLSKTLDWPVADWARLKQPPEPGQRAVLLLRTWAGEQGHEKADRWLKGLVRMMSDEGAPAPESIELKARTYGGAYPHERRGDAILWLSATG